MMGEMYVIDVPGAYVPTEMQGYYPDGMARPVYLKCRDALCSTLYRMRAEGEFPMPSRKRPVKAVTIHIIRGRGKATHSWMHQKAAADLCRSMKLMDGNGGYVEPTVLMDPKEDDSRTVVEVEFA